LSENGALKKQISYEQNRANQAIKELESARAEKLKLISRAVTAE
jgi:hypothetical protein